MPDLSLQWRMRGAHPERSESQWQRSAVCIPEAVEWPRSGGPKKLLQVYAGMGQIYQPFSTHQLEGFTTRCYFKHMFILNISKQNQLCGSFHPLASHGRAHIRFGRSWLSQDFDSLKVPDSGKVWKSPCTAGPQCLLLRWCGMGMRSCLKQSASNLIAIRCQSGCRSWDGFHRITIRVCLSSINV